MQNNRQGKHWAYMDRISELPNSVLSHILSFLPLKHAASTSVLSRRWQFLWTSVHNCDLEGNTTLLNSDLQQTHVIRTRRFENFVNNYFSHRDKDLCLKRFCLKFVSDCNLTHVDSWVLAAIASGVEELDLDLILYNKRFWFRLCIFTYKSLVVLKLGNGIVIDAPRSSIHLPNLKVLHLLLVDYENHYSFDNLISGCPRLENLVLKDYCELERLYASGFVISSSTLRELHIVQCHWLKSIILWVDAPSLENLSLCADRYRGVHLKNLNNLVKVVADFYLEYNNNVYGDKRSRIAEDFLGALYNVQVLTLAQSIILLIRDSSLNGVPVFHNLIRLELDGFCCFWLMLLSLLQKAPYLQHLSIQVEYFCSSCCVSLGPEAWTELEVSNCLSHLRTLCFNGAFGKDNDRVDMQFVTYVLKNSSVLENMTITYFSSLSSDKKHAFHQKLASLERGSKNCQLKFEGEVL